MERKIINIKLTKKQKMIKWCKENYDKIERIKKHMSLNQFTLLMLNSLKDYEKIKENLNKFDLQGIENESRAVGTFIQKFDNMIDINYNSLAITIIEENGKLKLHNLVEIYHDNTIGLLFNLFDMENLDYEIDFE
jgi:hypothetical protein